MRLRVWLRSGWGQAMLACALLAITLVASVAAITSLRGAGIQLFVTRDVSRPATVRLILKTVSLPPFGVSSQTCDGVAFQHGFPDQALYLGVGWYVDIPARPTGQSYHCIFKNAFVTRTLDIPASDAASDNGMSITAPSAHATLSRTTTVAFSFATTCESGGMTPQMALIADSAGHSAIAKEWGCGAGAGSGTFRPPQDAGFVAGPGTLAVYTMRMVFPAASGWSSATNIIYYTAVSVPVVWN
ncbi:MAG TPA: hypothetical protein VF510_10710 [Ktedonobacterales bacterium]